MGLEFRRRNYRAEEQAQSLPRTRANTHPLSVPAVSAQVEDLTGGKYDFFDPLRATEGKVNVLIEETQHEDVSSEETLSRDISAQLSVKEWRSFKKILMQRFPVSKTIPLSMASGIFVKGSTAIEKSSADLRVRESNDHNFFAEEDVNVISQQEYISQLQELKKDIRQSWGSDDRVTSLRLSIKVARLLMDTSVIQFYPTLFVLATDIMDMLGDLVWNRIKQRAEFAEDGGFICTLPDNFEVADISFDAKETCNNWFSKIGSVRELLPRIYLELAILPCWRFLLDNPKDVLQRLVLMTRGIANPLASAYCYLYMVQCAQRLPRHDTGYLITCINDLQVTLRHLISTGETTRGKLSGDSKLLLTMIEPTIEYTMKCLFKNLNQMETGNMLVALGMGRNLSTLFQSCSCISIILHHILMEVPIELICSNAVEILNLIECTNDCSFDKRLNFKLLGLKLCERIPEVSRIQLVVDIVIKVLSCHDNLDAYLMIGDAYLDIILENQLDAFLNVLLDGIFERALEEKIGENELVTLQSILSKCITHFGNIASILGLNHFVDILDMTYGSSRNSIHLHILSMATRNGRIQDLTIIEVLMQVAQALYDGVDFSNMRKDDYQHPSRVISHFVFMVDYGMDVESQLRFLAQCRGAFASISELQEMLVHFSNNLAVRAMRNGSSNISFIKSCLAFSEVTIPSIPTNLRQLNLYIETAEVALLGGFVSHSDGLIDAAVNCLRNADSVDGLPIPEDVNGIISSMCKLCGMLVMVPGSLEQGVACIPKDILYFLDSRSWILPRMKTKVLSAVVFLSAALAQNQLLYNTRLEVIGNNQLFFGVPSYPQELLSLDGVILHDIVNIVLQEPSMAIRGKIALEFCNCIASVFTMSDETLEACSKLVEIGRSCLSADNKFLQSTLMFLDEHQFRL